MKIPYDETKHIVCRICGKYMVQLPRHLDYAHRLTSEEYLKRYPGAEITSKDMKERKNKASVESWSKDIKRKEEQRERFINDNPINNVYSYNKMCKTRGEQGTLRTGCNFDGLPCKGPMCNGKIHPDRTGINSTAQKILKDRPEYIYELRARAKVNLGFDKGCIRDGKTICPNCNKIHKDFTGINCPATWPEVAARAAKSRIGHTYNGEPCNKCGKHHTNKSELQRISRAKQKPTWTSKQEIEFKMMLDDIGIDYLHDAWCKEINMFKTAEFNHEYHRFDFVLPKLKTVLELQGCYWHGCPICYPEFLDLSIHEPELFEYDVISQIRKYEEISQQVHDSGWIYIEIWEHEFKFINKLVKSITGHSLMEYINVPKEKEVKEKPITLT
jgi:G:T-mismatch repair DNA endonuclease (very short patch repair protein)